MTNNRGTQETNKAVVRRLLEEGLGQGNVKVMPDIIADEYVGHLAIGDHYGPEGVRINFAGYRDMIPDLSVTIDDLFADGDRVARRFTLRGTHRGPFPEIPVNGIPVVLRGIAIDRLVEGRVVETWVQVDSLPNDH